MQRRNDKKFWLDWSACSACGSPELKFCPRHEDSFAFYSVDGGIFFLLHDRLILFDKMALNQISQP